MTLRPGFILLAFFVFAAMGCTKQTADPAQLRAAETALIQTTVTDPVRAEQLLDLLEQRDRLVESTTAMLRQYRRELKAINADYNSSHDIIVAMIDSYNRDRAQKLLAFIELIANMKATTNAAEWKVIAKFQLDNFDPRLLVFDRATGGI